MVFLHISSREDSCKPEENTVKTEVYVDNDAQSKLLI